MSCSSDEVTRQTRVVIAEDHELTRYGLVMALEDSHHCKMVGEAENGQQAVDLVEKHQPDVVLMDIGMPVMNGITATQTIKAQWPQIKVVMLTSHQAEEEVFAALAAGADAYCMKDIKIDRLCHVVEMVEDGAIWLDPAIAKVVMNALPEACATANAQKQAARKAYNADLTEREREVLQLIVEGQSNKEIAQALNVTIHTAKAHVCNIIQKLAVDDRTQVAVKALKDGLINAT